ncbi:MAG: hypothetical protein JWO18_373 [Microbacteriaceae bacterium]|nr:hypothetical protein [Microbacteriaceae bacterium]
MKEISPSMAILARRFERCRARFPSFGTRMARVFWWGFAVLFAVIGLVSFFAGTTIGGHIPPSSQCSLSADVPDKGGPYYENTTVTGAVTYFPLGIVCTYDSPDDSIGPQTVAHRNWGETIVSFVSLVGVVLGIVLGAIQKRQRPSGV